MNESDALHSDSVDMWYKGDWQGLRRLTREILEPHEKRAELALLVAAAHHQQADREQTIHWAKTARDWGADEKMLARILVAGIHNTLGRCAAIAGDHPRMESQFQLATSLDLHQDDEMSARVRTMHQLNQLGLLPDAMASIAGQIQSVDKICQRREWLESHLTILRTELALLQQELMIAQRRGQIGLVRQDSASDHLTLGEAETSWLEELGRKATSQLGQDLWVLERTSYKRGGFFVEFGATNGILLSNTFLLEREFGWNGICAEPNPLSFRDLEKNRLCTLSPACIGAITGEEVEFIFADVYGGMARDAACDKHQSKREAYKAAGETAMVRTISLHDFLTQHNAPRRIDYVSIDTEGSEFAILETFPFDQWDVRMFTIEHNFTEQRGWIRNLLEAKGYTCKEADWDDWYYKTDSPEEMHSAGKEPPPGEMA